MLVSRVAVLFGVYELTIVNATGDHPLRSPTCIPCKSNPLFSEHNITCP